MTVHSRPSSQHVDPVKSWPPHCSNAATGSPSHSSPGSLSETSSAEQMITCGERNRVVGSRTEVIVSAVAQAMQADAELVEVLDLGSGEPLTSTSTDGRF